jgi:hypothetical protein
VLLVAGDPVGSLRNVAKKVPVTMTDDRSVAQVGGAENTFFRLLLDMRSRPAMSFQEEIVMEGRRRKEDQQARWLK